MPQNRKDEPHVLLITGQPGVGKTTLIRRVAERIEPGGLRGFYTEEIREAGERRGFRLVSFEGTTRVIAHVDFPKHRRVGKYGVDVEALDDAAALLLPDPSARVYIIDEIGKMECLSAHLVAAMRALIAGSAPVVATVGARGGGFIAEVKMRPDCDLREVTRDNRDGLPARVLAWLAGKA
jgi:nucleoside-triphosphatase